MEGAASPRAGLARSGRWLWDDSWRGNGAERRRAQHAARPAAAARHTSQHTLHRRPPSSRQAGRPFIRRRALRRRFCEGGQRRQRCCGASASPADPSLSASFSAAAASAAAATAGHGGHALLHPKPVPRPCSTRCARGGGSLIAWRISLLARPAAAAGRGAASSARSPAALAPRQRHAPRRARRHCIVRWVGRPSSGKGLARARLPPGGTPAKRLPAANRRCQLAAPP